MTESDGLPSVYDAMADDHDAEAAHAPSNQDLKCCQCSERATRFWDGEPICNGCFWELIIV